MNDCVAGSPLKRLTWSRATNTVNIEFRDGVSREDQIDFLLDLWKSAQAQFIETFNSNPKGK